MTDTRLPGLTGASPARFGLPALRRHLVSRRGRLALAAVALTAGLATNWSWVVAAGVAPLLLSALPCVAMCALGVCMMGRSCGKSGTPAAPPTVDDGKG